MSFAHLHVHTEFSLLDGLSKIPVLLDRVKAHGQSACAITDHGAMYGVVHFYNQAKAAGIKPIIGVEAYMSLTDRTSKQARQGSDQFHITLLAKNDQGYRNLMQLTTIAHLEGFSYKPRIDFAALEQLHEGLIATSGCSSSIINRKIQQGDFSEAAAWAKRFLDLFGKDFYIEIQSHPSLEIVEKHRQDLVKLAHDFGIPLVATNDVHYVDQDDAVAQDALLAVQTRKMISDTSRLSMLNSPDFYLKSTEEMKAAFLEYPEAIANTVKIADQCNVTIPTGKMIFPEYPLPPGATPEKALYDMAHARLIERFKPVPQEMLDRLNYELDIICNKGYASYFLIVQDFVNWSKAQGIRVGPGRGSAAGSLVSYVLRITSINPLEHSLPFERFMNPQRPSPPDIDIDIADERRDEVIRYVSEKYGEDHVAQIITFGTMEGRAAIRDIGRVLGMPFSDPDKVAKLIPLKFSIQNALESVFELQELYKEPKFKRLIDLAKKVEGNSRHASTHAAGVVVADKPLSYYTPIQREARAGKIVTQYDMYALDLNISDDAIGLLKIDFLGLRNLSILGRAIRYVREHQKLHVDLSDIPLDEPSVFDMLSAGHTTGVFQLESAGMRRVARKLKPSRFSDITAMVALYRPGPMELIDDFIAGKHDPSRIKYPHQDLKPVLEETYGIPVYQEQVLQIANVFAGYSLGEADILRRAIGKKKKSILEKEKKRFIKGARDKGYTKDNADTIWGFIDKFAGYGFNKSHSASYAMIAYQTAYMKCLYPVEYMASLLTVESGSHGANKDEKVAQAIEECRRMGIVVLPPEINHSRSEFSLEENKSSLHKTAIRFGLTAIKNVGLAAIESIEAEQAKGPFASVTDFCLRVDNRKVNKKVLESLIKVGTFDSFSHRAAVLASLDDIRSIAAGKQAIGEQDQVGLFDTSETHKIKPTDTFADVPPFSPTESLQFEKELMGIFLSSNPYQDIFATLSSFPHTSIEDIDMTHNNRIAKMAGIVTSVRQVITKAGNKEMAFAQLTDPTGTFELVFFPKIYDTMRSILHEDLPVIIKGKVQLDDERRCLLVESLEPISLESTPPSAPESKPGVSRITIPRGTDKSILQEIGKLLKAHPGEDRIDIHIHNGQQDTVLHLPYRVDYSVDLQSKITSLLKGSSL